MQDRDYNWRRPDVRITRSATSPLSDSVADALGYALALGLLYLAWWL